MPYTTINKSSAHMNSKIYTGNGSTQSITGVGHQPDLVWIKDRSEANWHNLYDSVRGVTKRIFSNTSGAEETQAQGLTAFDTDGFSVGSNVDVNKNNNNYVSWNWKAGTSFTNSAGSNGADIASSGSVNTAAGFSIIKATSDSAADKNIAHGLGVVPDVIFSKNLDSGYNWDIYFKELGYNAALRLNSTNTTLTGRWGSSAFTANTFQTKENYSSTNGEEYIYYCFASKTGFSKFGSYYGNSSTDGEFIYLGFRPAFVIIKRTNSTKDWFVWDNKTAPRNPTNAYLRVNTDGVAGSYDWLDFVGNGIKIRNTSDGANNDGDHYVYMAFGQSIVGSNDVCATAR